MLALEDGQLALEMSPKAGPPPAIMDGRLKEEEDDEDVLSIASLFTNFVPGDKEEDDDLEDAPPSNAKSATRSRTSKGVLRSRRFLVMSAVQGITITAIVMAQELNAIWCILPISRGGLQWSPKTIGQVWGMFGVALIGLQMNLVPLVLKRAGNLWTLRVALLVLIVLNMLPPWIGLFNPEIPKLSKDAVVEPMPITFALFIVVAALQQLTNQLAFSSIATLVSLATPADTRVRAAGVALSVQSVFMAVGPLVAGSILAASVELMGEQAADPRRTFPGGTHTAFLLSSWLLGVAWLVLMPFHAGGGWLVEEK